MISLQLKVLDCGVQIACGDHESYELLQSIYYCFKRPLTQALLNYDVASGSGHDVFITRHGGCRRIATGYGDLICKFDRDVIVETQKLRADLYFVHAAVLAFNGRAIALVAPSGFGKSTTTWALLHHGFEYLSDEIAPIDVKSLRVLPFPRALCLKKNPPDSYRVPADAIVAERTIHVPVSHFLREPASEPVPLSMMFFVRFIGQDQSPILKRMRSADATVRLLINTLNPRAHSQYGLDDAFGIVAKTSSFELFSGDLLSTCELIRAACVEESRDAETRLDLSSL
jgi:hypothetical protein